MNIVEHLRKASVERLFEMTTFARCWTVWRAEIEDYVRPLNETNVINLGDHLSEVFGRTGQSGRSQAELSGGGYAWEGLICWYLNLCLIGSRAVVFKHIDSLIPEPVKKGITVNYGNLASNSESDLIAIVLPDRAEYKTLDKYAIRVQDEHGRIIPVRDGSQYNYLPVMNGLVARDFESLEIHIIQCKTNWKDNAQIPMLWDMVYSAQSFGDRNITIGRNGYTIQNTGFSYSFVTVPSNHDVGSTAIERVRNLSGGNYWGRPSEQAVASSVKEMLTRNFINGYPDRNPRGTLRSELGRFEENYDYFRITP